MHLVLLPGMDGSGKLLEPVAEWLRERHGVTVASYPGDRELGYEELLPVVREAVPSDEPLGLVAESFAGPLAVRWAAAEPERVRALVLSTSFVDAPAPGWLAPAASLAMRLSPRLFERFLLVGRSASAEQASALQESIEEAAPRVLAHRLRAILSVETGSTLRRLECPVLYLQGERDRLLGGRAARRIRSLRPDARVVTVDGPHVLLLTRPAECAEHVERFLAQLD